MIFFEGKISPQTKSELFKFFIFKLEIGFNSDKHKKKCNQWKLTNKQNIKVN